MIRSNLKERTRQAKADHDIYVLSITSLVILRRMAVHT